jgi:large subunit ribosomal protein L15
MGKMGGRGIKVNRVPVWRSRALRRQMPLYQHVCQSAATKPNRKKILRWRGWFDQKFIDEEAGLITEDSLMLSALIRRKLDGIRVLAKGNHLQITIDVTGAPRNG